MIGTTLFHFLDLNNNLYCFGAIIRKQIPVLQEVLDITRYRGQNVQVRCIPLDCRQCLRTPAIVCSDPFPLYTILNIKEIEISALNTGLRICTPVCNFLSTCLQLALRIVEAAGTTLCFLFDAFGRLTLTSGSTADRLTDPATDRLFSGRERRLARRAGIGFTAARWSYWNFTRLNSRPKLLGSISNLAKLAFNGVVGRTFRALAGPERLEAQVKVSSRT